jgi:hypothetical protein
MKGSQRLVPFVLFFFPYSLLSQNSTSNSLYSPRVIYDCESVSWNAADLIIKRFNPSQLNSINDIIKEWMSTCGDSEVAYRMIILESLVRGELAMDQLRQYFEKDLHYVLKNRIQDSNQGDFGYVYTSHKEYYGFIPLRHSIDSLTEATAKQLLQAGNLSREEELVCKLFSWNVDAFTQALEDNQYNETFIKSTLKKRVRDYAKNSPAFILYTGIYNSIGTEHVFSQRPTFGLQLSSPLSNPFIVECGFKFRINQNDQSFQFYALGDTNIVNSDMSLFLGITIGYKLLERDKFLIVPKVGAGLESVSTGISKQKKNSDETTYYDVETVHLTTSMAIMTPMFKTRYIGLEAAYHYCPYGLEENLYTKFNNHSYSLELFFRF